MSNPNRLFKIITQVGPLEDVERNVKTFFETESPEFIRQCILYENPNKITPLMIACSKNSPLIVDKIINFLTSPLQDSSLAASSSSSADNDSSGDSKNEEVVSEYINYQDNRGYSALHYCFHLKVHISLEKMLDCARLLLDYGADSNLVSIQSQFTPLILFYYTLTFEINLLDLDLDLHDMDVEHFPEIVDHLLRFGTNPNLQDNMGMTALMHSIRCVNYHGFNHEFIMADLLNDECGVEVNIQDKRGYTALMHAVDEESLMPVNHEMVRCLLEKGADPNLESNDGKTALVVAVQNSRASVNDIRLLLDHGAELEKVTPSVIASIENAEVKRFISDVI